jgi:hypothetical protein
MKAGNLTPTTMFATGYSFQYFEELHTKLLGSANSKSHSRAPVIFQSRITAIEADTVLFAAPCPTDTLGLKTSLYVCTGELPRQLAMPSFFAGL